MSASAELAYSRRLLAVVHSKVMKAAPDLKLAGTSWVVPTAADALAWEFHGPDGFRWRGPASDAYAASAAGWCAWLTSRK